DSRIRTVDPATISRGTASRGGVGYLCLCQRDRRWGLGPLSGRGSGEGDRGHRAGARCEQACPPVRSARDLLEMTANPATQHRGADTPPTPPVRRKKKPRLIAGVAPPHPAMRAVKGVLLTACCLVVLLPLLSVVSTSLASQA